jgi:hypothetical protein
MSKGMETDGVKNLLATLNDLVKSVSGKLKENILEKTLSESIDEISRKGELENNEAISELEQAKLLNMYSYILVSLYFTNLKLSGVKLNNESYIMQEIKRIKEYMDKVKSAEESLKKNEVNERKKEDESQIFIKTHLSGHEPAVSKVHFQNKNTESGNHVRFNNDETLTGTKNAQKIKEKFKKAQKNIKIRDNVKGEDKQSKKVSKASKVSKEYKKKKTSKI